MRLPSKVLLPLFVLIVASLVAGAVVATRPRPTQDDASDLGVLVEVAAVHRQARRLDVEAQGTVIPARKVDVQPQVSGRIAAVFADLAPGTLVKTGDLLFAIEESDFALAVERQRAALAEAKAQLELERGRQRVAQREWELFQDEIKAQQHESSLALREPQLRAAEAAVATAEARLGQAELDLARTQVRSPFNAVVLSEAIEVGQTVTPQSRALTLVGTDHFWIQASVPIDELRAIEIPEGERAEGSKALIRLDGDRWPAHEGRVLRLLSDLDRAGRMARVLVSVPDPLGLRNQAGEPKTKAGLVLLDSYVDLTIEGRRSEALYELPREWLHDGTFVWICADDLLEVREVEVIWRSQGSVYLRGGLEEGELVITSRLATPIEGMKLRRQAAVITTGLEELGSVELVDESSTESSHPVKGLSP